MLITHWLGDRVRTVIGHKVHKAPSLPLEVDCEAHRD